MSSRDSGSGDARVPPADSEEAIIPLRHANLDENPTVIGPSRTAGSPMPLNPGERIGHFEIIAPIGRGGMAAVLQARDLELQRIVALKILPPELAIEPDAVLRFKQEARAAAMLDHDHIARVFFCGEDRGLHFIAFEYVPGESLRDRLRRQGRLSPAEAVKFLLQLAAGLAHAAERGVVHRDIKPGNIVIGPDGQAKLVDMGLARPREPAVPGGVTQSHVTLGTYDYLAPEQALDPRRADGRSDIYSLGCTFYHALTGRPPVPHGTAAAKLHAHQHEAPIDPRDLNPAVPDALAAVLARMMAKDPNDRYAHAAELHHDLLRLQDDGCTEPLTLPPTRPSRGLAAALAVTACLTAILLTVTRLAPGPDQPGVPVWLHAPIGFAQPEQLANHLTHQADQQDEAHTGVEGLGQDVRLLPPIKAADNERVLWPEARGEDASRRLYGTMSAALAAVQPGDAITIAANGEVPVPMLPEITRPLVIRAATGFQPVLVPEGPRYRTESVLFRVVSGELVLEGLGIRLTDRHAVASVLGGAACLFRGCRITLLGRPGSPAAVAAIPDIARELRAAAPPRIELTNCLVHGMGRMLWVHSPRAFFASLDHCGLALEGGLMMLESGGTAANPPQGRLLLRHCTLAFEEPIFAFRASGSTAFLEVQTHGCLFTPLDSRATPPALVRFDEADPGSLVSQFLSWSGRGSVFAFADTATAVEWKAGPGDILAWDFNQWRRFARDDARMLPRVRFARGGLKPKLLTLNADDFMLSTLNPLEAGVNVPRLAAALNNH